jgi:hypothetical protein
MRIRLAFFLICLLVGLHSWSQSDKGDQKDSVHSSKRTHYTKKAGVHRSRPREQKPSDRKPSDQKSPDTKPPGNGTQPAGAAQS